jgi:hypothetical protein
MNNETMADLDNEREATLLRMKAGDSVERFLAQHEAETKAKEAAAREDERIAAFTGASACIVEMDKRARDAIDGASLDFFSPENKEHREIFMVAIATDSSVALIPADALRVAGDRLLVSISAPIDPAAVTSEQHALVLLEDASAAFVAIAQENHALTMAWEAEIKRQAEEDARQRELQAEAERQRKAREARDAHYLLLPVPAAAALHAAAASIGKQRQAMVDLAKLFASPKPLRAPDDVDAELDQLAAQLARPHKDLAERAAAEKRVAQESDMHRYDSRAHFAR